MSEAKEADARRREVLIFCPCCFATNEDGSWQHTVDETYCSNCGAGGEFPRLPRWAVESIRRQASWVGKRYYPHEEDRQTYEELQLLRALAPPNPSDVARQTNAGAGDTYWTVERVDPVTNTRFSIVPIYAATAEEAIQRAKLKLRYIPPEAYYGQGA